MPLSRSDFRNTLFYDATNPEVVLGGFRQNGSITEANFLSILKILILSENEPLRVQARISGHVVTANDISLAAGDYDLYCNGPIQVTDEVWIERGYSFSISGMEDRFRNQIRARDCKCVISGFANSDYQIQLGIWGGFEASHIFPLKHESIWVKKGYASWVTDMDGVTGSTKINSAQNGFLLDSGIHHLFDQYLISINPDDGYKVVAFDPNLRRLDGGILDPVCRNRADPHRVSDDILRWHYRQSVLANVKGGGAPIVKHMFPPGVWN